MTAALEAHFRLCESLTRRTHEWSPPKKPSEKARVPTGRGKGGNNRKAVVIDGHAYATRKAAMKALRIGTYKLKAMLEDGRARRG